MVLEKDSSLLGYPGEVSKPLDADHNGICKYESRDDSRYRSVRDALKDLLRRSQKKCQLSPLILKAISALLITNKLPNPARTQIKLMRTAQLHVLRISCR